MIHVESNNLSIYIEISNMQGNCLKILNIEDFEIFVGKLLRTLCKDATDITGMKCNFSKRNNKRRLR